MTTSAILFVDDEPIMRRLFVRALEPHFSVIAAGSAEQAIFKLKESTHQIGIIFTDIRMPDRDGISLIDQLNSEYGHIPIVVCTGDLSLFDFDSMIVNNKIMAAIEKPMTAKQAIEIANPVLGQGIE